MRDILLAGNAGFIFSCVGGFLVHRALWKSADEHAQQLDAMVGNETNQASTSAARRQVCVSISASYQYHAAVLRNFVFFSPYPSSKYCENLT